MSRRGRIETQPFVYGWTGTPQRYKAILSECQNTICSLYTMRRAFPSLREMTQDPLQTCIDVLLTMTGMDDRMELIKTETKR